MKSKTLLIVAGPTAVGKTNLCINLAKKFNTCIISCDSRQFFKEINIGTAKPSEEELASVPHYFINSLSIRDAYDVRKFEEDTIPLLADLFEKHTIVIMTGGSGMYIDAITSGLDDMPLIDPAVRTKLNRQLHEDGLEPLQVLLKKLDPDYHSEVDLQNPQRVLRALEVCLGTGKSFSSFRVRKKTTRPFLSFKIGLQLDRKDLYARINERMDTMIQNGLFEEVASLYPFKHLNALQTVGYKEIFDFMDGRYDMEEAIRLLKRNTRRYAKRQMTWFRKDKDIHWFYPGQYEEILDSIHHHLRNVEYPGN